ncbi:MAG TPA: sigma-70 family RNA polymerase sigma factor [Rudaea sp.]|nr:sigma-70 family RNA polymerase sigma factor [Rudaea sp.]
MSAGYEPMAAATGAEPDIVARIAGGDRAAESEFVRRFERGVRALVRRHCRPGDPIVDDLVQDVLTGVIERLRAGAIHDSGALPGYVQAAAVYATTAEYRRRRPTQNDATIENLAGSDSPTARLEAAQLSTMLRTLLAEMPVARDREILARFYLDEQDKDDVCRVLDIDPAHFHRVVFRARERFRTLLEQAGIGGGQ